MSSGTIDHIRNPQLSTAEAASRFQLMQQLNHVQLNRRRQQDSQLEAVIEYPRIVAATLTCSGPAGRAVAAAAGRCLKKTVLELGGSDPYVILEDADLGLAAREGATSRAGCSWVRRGLPDGR